MVSYLYNTVTIPLTHYPPHPFHRAYKRNLQNMYIIHPNVGIKMFFEFSRVFLSKKFYDKLSYVEHIVDFQRIVSPLQVPNYTLTLT